MVMPKKHENILDEINTDIGVHVNRSVQLNTYDHKEEMDFQTIKNKS